MLLDSGAVSAIVTAGLLANVFAIFFAFSRHRSASQTATKLVDLALGGRADEARIQARNATREISPILDALGGDLSAPKRRTPSRELLLALALAIPPFALTAYAFSAVSEDSGPKRAIATAFLVGFAILAPLSLAAIAAIINLGRETSRAIRGSCITLLARQVKNAVDLEVADALRRGSTTRDPRGD